MPHERAPERQESMIDGKPETTSWDFAHERLADPEPNRHAWLATVRPDGRPHLMPVIPFWIDGAFHMIVGEGTRKGRNLAADSRCVIAIEDLRLPSLDLVFEGRAEPLEDADAVRTIAERLKESGWPLEARGVEVHGPNAPTAGPPPYRIYRMVPSKAFGLPGNYGMDKAGPEGLPKPTRWEFAAD